MTCNHKKRSEKFTLEQQKLHLETYITINISTDIAAHENNDYINSQTNKALLIANHLCRSAKAGASDL